MPRTLEFMSEPSCYLAHSAAACTPASELTEVLARMNRSVSRNRLEPRARAGPAFSSLRICFKSLGCDPRTDLIRRCPHDGTLHAFLTCSNGYQNHCDMSGRHTAKLKAVSDASG